jgi:hypothetical protein
MKARFACARRARTDVARILQCMGPYRRCCSAKVLAHDDIDAFRALPPRKRRDGGEADPFRHDETGRTVRF